MFRLQNNTPSNYVDESRDFQLLCRLYDIVNNGVRYDIKSMVNLLDANICLDSTLDLLATRKGFFTNNTFDTKLYRALLDGFPYIQKYKGSKIGVEMVVSLILRLDGLLTNAKVEWDKNNSRVDITTDSDISNKTALDTLLKYILPIGVHYSLNIVKNLDSTNTSQINSKDSIKIRKYLSSATNSNVADITNIDYNSYKTKTVTNTITDTDVYTPTSTSMTTIDGTTTSTTVYNNLIDNKIKLNTITVTSKKEPNTKYDHSIDSTEIIGSKNYSETNNDVENYKVENDEINEETNG